eukprot:11492276-Alexandrium_andersonii.AAC.1
MVRGFRPRRRGWRCAGSCEPCGGGGGCGGSGPVAGGAGEAGRALGGAEAQRRWWRALCRARQFAPGGGAEELALDEDGAEGLPR